MAAAMIDVHGVAAGRGDEPDPGFEHLGTDQVGLHDEGVRPLGRDPFGQLCRVVHAQGVLLDPGVVNDVRHLLEAVEPLPAQRCRNQDPRTPACKV